MEKEVLISVIVPVYKAEKYINKCVDSILAQTYSNFEIILIEDGSPDNSGKICDEYALKDNRIRAFHKTNGGVSSARNVGLKEAKGDLVCFIDSDDFVEKDYFEAIAANANYDLGIYGYELLSISWKISEIFSASFTNRDDSIDIIKKYIETSLFKAIMGKILIREKIVENKLFFNEKMRVGEDTEFIYRYWATCQTLYVNTNSYYIYKEDNYSPQKYKLLYEDFTYHYTHLNAAIKMIDDNWNFDASVLYSFCKNFYYGLFIKSILSCSFFEYLKNRKLFIKNFKKEYDLDILCIKKSTYQLFLRNVLTSIFLFTLYKLLRKK